MLTHKHLCLEFLQKFFFTFQNHCTFFSKKKKNTKTKQTAAWYKCKNKTNAIYSNAFVVERLTNIFFFAFLNWRFRWMRTKIHVRKEKKKKQQHTFCWYFKFKVTNALGEFLHFTFIYFLPKYLIEKKNGMQKKTTFLFSQKSKTRSKTSKENQTSVFWQS